MKTFWYILASACLMVSAGCDERPTSGAIDGQQSASQGTAVTVEDFRYNRLPGGRRILTGKFRNGTGTHIRNAQILVSLYDGHNQRISTMNIDIKDVAPGADKAFRETVDSDLDVRGAKVRSVLLL